MVFGQAAGWGTSLDLSTLNGTNGFRLDGVALQERAGQAVDGAGDVNGDGIDDLFVGAQFDFTAGPFPAGNEGGAYVVFGKTSWTSSLSLGSLDGTTGFKIEGIDPQDLAGLHVGRAGDVNGDTYDDLILAAPGIDDGGADAGGAYVVFGAATWTATFDLAGLTGANGFRIDGIAAGDFAGEDVAGVGDLNGDGLADLGVSVACRRPGRAKRRRRGLCGVRRRRLPERLARPRDAGRRQRLPHRGADIRRFPRHLGLGRGRRQRRRLRRPADRGL